MVQSTRHTEELDRMKRILVVGDAHVEANQDLRRFGWINQAIHQMEPDGIIFMGDFLSLDALSEWDRDKRKLMEGRRYWKELEAGNKALDMALKGVDLPVYFLMGNHEDRLDRYLEKHPELEGTGLEVSANLKLLERDITPVAYKEHLLINGINFTHIPMAKHGHALSGANITTKALDLYNTSIVFGHTHKLEVHCKMRHGAAGLQQALNVGCFFEHHFDYVKGSPRDYWRGVCLLILTEPQRFDLITINLDRLRKEF